MTGMTRGTRVMTRGRGGDKGRDKGGLGKVTRGMRKGVPGARMRRGNPPPRWRGNLRVATRERGSGLTHYPLTRRRPAK